MLHKFAKFLVFCTVFIICCLLFWNSNDFLWFIFQNFSFDTRGGGQTNGKFLGVT